MENKSFKQPTSREAINRKKMYKDGKVWAVTGMTFITSAILLAGGVQNVSADDSVAPANSDTTLATDDGSSVAKSVVLPTNTTTSTTNSDQSGEADQQTLTTQSGQSDAQTTAVDDDSTESSTTISVVDDTTGKSLTSFVITGTADSRIYGSDGWSEFNQFLDQNVSGTEAQYMYASTGLPDALAERIGEHPVVEVHLVHKLAPTTDTKTVTGTIAYTGAGDKTPATVNQSVTVNHTYMKDEVTGEAVSTDDDSKYYLDAPFVDNRYTVDTTKEADGTVDATTGDVTFNTVNNKSINGFTLDKPSVTLKTNFANPMVADTVTYSEILKKIHTELIDDTTGKILASLDYSYSPTGSPNTEEWWSWMRNVVYPILGIDPDSSNPTHDDVKKYAIVSSFVTAGGTKSEMHVVHKLAPTTDTKTVTGTISYTGAGDKTPATVNQSVTVNHTYMKDEVTGEAVSTEDDSKYYLDAPFVDNRYTVDTTKQADGTVDNTTGDVTFNTVNNKSIDGFTLDKPSVTLKTNFANPMVADTVTYSEILQKAHVDLVDDTTGKILASLDFNGSPMSVGPANTEEYGTWLRNVVYPIWGIDSNNSNPTPDDIKNYAFVSENITSASWDDDSSVDQKFEIHVKHTYSTVKDQKTVNETIHYVYGDGSKAADDVVNSATFTRENVKDNVTGDVTYGDWSENQMLDAVITPQITGYTADRMLVPAKVVSGDASDTDVTITYSKNGADHNNQGDTTPAPTDTTPKSDATDQTADTTTTEPGNVVQNEQPSVDVAETVATGVAVDPKKATAASTVVPDTEVTQAGAVELPHTAALSHNRWAIVGWSLLTMLAIMLGLKKKSKED
jgi:hypothetical protein